MTKKSRLGQTQFGFVESSYSVTYAYIYEGKSYEGDGKVDALTYITGSRGEEIMVRVSSKHPSLARLASEEPAGLQVGWVAALTGGIAFYLIGGFLLGFLGEWRNLRKGRVVIGVAVSSSHRYEGYGKYRKFHAHIKVRLRTQTGKSITKTVESRDEALLPYLRGNQKVAIFYVDDAHWWLL